MKHLALWTLVLSIACLDTAKEEDEERDDRVFFEGDRQGDCFDGEDNDEDGLTDCQDPGCEEREVCQTTDETEVEPTEEVSPLDTDDDGDGFTENQGDCDDTDPDIGPDDCDQEQNLTWDANIAPLFQSYGCAGCHYGYSDRATILSTNAGDIYPDQAGANMPWVTPNEPENSYLYHKIADTHADVGGAGVQMPQGMDPMSAADIELVESWILGGAN